MRNHITIVLLISSCFLVTPITVPASGNGPGNAAAIVEPDRGNFERDVVDAAARMREALRMPHRDKFFTELYKVIDSGDIGKAEELLKKRDKDVPDQKNDEAYAIAKSKIAYAKGDYPTAFAEADGLIAEIEKAFAPQKPYEVAYKNKNERDTVFDVYILRFQALSQMRRNEEALTDLNSAQRLVESPELFRAKTSILLWLGKYAEAAASADKAYAMDKSIFVTSPHREQYCQLFSSQGYNVKTCAAPSAAN